MSQEILVVSETELLIIEAPAQTLVDAPLTPQELLEIAIQGPAGPVGATGATGPVGPVGPVGPNGGIDMIAEASDVLINNAMPGDVLAFNGVLWTNNSQSRLTDGGNF